MNVDVLEQALGSGEDSFTEFKQAEVHPDQMAAEMIAFANAEGGTIYIGIDDQGQVVGVDNPKLEEWVVQVARNNCDPAMFPVIKKINYRGKQVLAVYIARGTTAYSNNKGQYFIRVGSTKQVPSKEELARLFQHRAMFCFDESPVPVTDLPDLALDKINAYLKKIGQAPIEQSLIDQTQLLNNLKITHQAQPTIAGLLLFGKSGILPQSGVSAAAFAGADVSAKTSDAKNIEGTLPDQLSEALHFVERNMSIKSEINGLQRHDHPEYDRLVVREALVNALAHRDYSITGSRIRLNMFADRLEISSPGGLPNTLTLENIKTIQYSRNPIVVSFLTGLGYMERRGEGIMRMIRGSQSIGALAPRFDLPDRQLFRVTLYKAG